MSDHIRVVSIIFHTGKKAAASLAARIVSWLEGQGIEVRLPGLEAKVLGRPELVTENGYGSADLLLVFGGDGTILRAAEQVRGAGIPIFGVNLGRFGFLSSSEADGLEDQLNRLFSGSFQIRERMMLDYAAYQGEKEIAQGQVLNEVVVESSERRLMTFSLYVNGEFFLRPAADGAIFATPTGSTAYSLSAGGPVVTPHCKVTLWTPLCPHSLFNRPLVFASDDVLEMRLEAPISFSVDGRQPMEESIDRVVVRGSADVTRLVETDRNAFYRLLREKLAINRPAVEEG